MFIYPKFQNGWSLVGMFALVTFGGCTVHLPPAPANNPADPRAPAAATAPLQPTLLASSRSFLSPVAGPREKPAPSQPSRTEPSPVSSATATIFTCPMHPEVHETKPGNCPICGMTLVKKPPAPEGAIP
jgi:Heavy metal binding domain